MEVVFFEHGGKVTVAIAHNGGDILQIFHGKNVIVNIVHDLNAKGINIFGSLCRFLRRNVLECPHQIDQHFIKNGGQELLRVYFGGAVLVNCIPNQSGDMFLADDALVGGAVILFNVQKFLSEGCVIGMKCNEIVFQRIRTVRLDFMGIARKGKVNVVFLNLQRGSVNGDDSFSACYDCQLKQIKVNMCVDNGGAMAERSSDLKNFRSVEIRWVKEILPHEMVCRFHDDLLDHMAFNLLYHGFLGKSRKNSITIVKYPLWSG